MATGNGVQGGRGNVVSDVTPNIDLRTGEPEMWDAAERLTQQITESMKPGLERRARARGAAEGAEAARRTNAGETPETPETPGVGPWFLGGDIAEARADAASRAYLAGVQNEIDARESAARTEASHDVEAYRERMAAVRSGFIQGAAPDFAVDIETYINNRVVVGEASVAGNAAAVREREQAADFAVREANLRRQIVDELDRAGTPTPLHDTLRGDWEELRDARLANPAIPYSAEEAAEDERELQVLSKAAIYTSYAVGLLRSEGPVSALGSLQTILEDPDLRESESSVVFQRVRERLNTEINLASDQQNQANAARQQAEREITRRIEENVAAAELGLPDTPLTQGEVMSVLGADGVAEWYRQRGEALERNRETGSLVGLTPEQAAQRIADANEVASASAGFQPLVDWIINESEGSALVADDNGAGRARFGITERSHPDAWRDGDVTRQEAVAIYKREYWDAIGADGLSEALRIVAFDAAINHGPGRARDWIEESGGDAARFIQLRREHYQALARQDPARYGGDLRGWMNRLDAVTTRVNAMGAGDLLAQQISNATEGFASDPIQFAGAHRLAAPASLPVDGVFQGGQAGAHWGQALRSRAALGGNLADDYGVPLRYFTDGEVATYRDRLERDPAAAVDFARAATEALGARGAREALAEIGQDTSASTAIHIADLIATGGDTRFADQAAAGLTLKDAGQTLDTELRTEIREELARHRSPFRNAPALLQAITNSVEAAALADSVGGSPRPARYYVQAAMGRTSWQGRPYGGVADLNGQQTLIPRWLNPEYSDDAMQAFAENWVERNRGPVYGNDEPISAREISRMRLVNMPNGRYRLVDRDNRVAYARSGRPFEVDFEGGRDFLARVLGNNAVRPER